VRALVCAVLEIGPATQAEIIEKTGFLPAQVEAIMYRLRADMVVGVVEGTQPRQYRLLDSKRPPMTRNVNDVLAAYRLVREAMREG
jgi:hypothetical protein